MNIDEEEPNCNICFEVFDDEEHSPRTLRCGHTLCTPCIDVLVKKSLPDRVCPECRKTLKISNAAHLPISYTILRLSRALTKAKPSNDVQIQVVDNNTCMMHGAPTISWCPLSDKWHCFKCVHADNCDSLLAIPEAFLHIKQNYSQIVETKVSNANNHSKTLKKESEVIKKEISSSEKRLEDMVKQIQKTVEWEKLLETDEAELVEASSTIKLTKSIKRLKRDVAEFDAWLEKCKPSVKSRISSQISGPPPSLDFAGLIEQLLHSQNMYVVLESDEESRWGRLSIDDHYLVMYALDIDAPPRDAVVVPFKEACDSINLENATAFFDIAYNDTYEGRVYMEMFGDTPRAKQFLKLCTGEEYVCYRESVLMEFDEDHLRYLRTGHNIEGDPLVDNIKDGGPYCKVLAPGLLNGWKSGGEHWALCDIVLECKPHFEDDYIFGKVICGLGILEGACASSRSKTSIEIVNCGIVVANFL